MEFLQGYQTDGVYRLKLGGKQFSRKKREREPPYIFVSDEETRLREVGPLPTYEIHIPDGNVSGNGEFTLVGRVLLPGIPEEKIRTGLRILFREASSYPFTINPIEEEHRRKTLGPYKLFPLVEGGDGKELTYRVYSVGGVHADLLEMRQYVPWYASGKFDPQAFYAMIGRLQSTATRTLEERLNRFFKQ